MVKSVYVGNSTYKIHVFERTSVVRATIAVFTFNGIFFCTEFGVNSHLLYISADCGHGFLALLEQIKLHNL